jgi:hypothetical protein
MDALPNEVAKVKERHGPAIDPHDAKMKISSGTG